MKKIVIASDSFKGSVSSLDVANSVESAVRRIFPECETLKIPVADGGEGTTEALVYATNGQMISCIVHDPLMSMIQAEYGILGDSLTAVIEIAAACGLPLVAKDKRNPMLTTSYGIGELIMDALRRGCRHFLVGIGGSATNDAGTGMLQALGFRFMDKNGKELTQGGKILNEITTIDHSRVVPMLRDATFTIACDVTNPFSGQNGAACVYAHQKGADEQMIRTLDKGLKHFASVIRRNENKDIDTVPGAGAGGGLGGGFLAFLPAILKSGIQMILDVLHFEERIKDADLVFTGEGRLDQQTCMGKTPLGVLQVAMKQHIPVIAVCGSVEESEALNELGFLAIFPVQPGIVTPEQAMNREFAMYHIERTVEQILRAIRAMKRMPSLTQ
jgi:glycerate kinase